ncbi:uncharacterized protein TrAtP1_006183 [Trichoderma atroviride]|uniref:uncharacterized protein n=1 Tax=Hypocrea atroviridis TaxID=63577 RepID=UPI00333298AB|nr:hypothetical protein TrAtP1_006183 [Trichoderma atroviride]
MEPLFASDRTTRILSFNVLKQHNARFMFEAPLGRKHWEDVLLHHWITLGRRPKIAAAIPKEAGFRLTLCKPGSAWSKIHSLGASCSDMIAHTHTATAQYKQK